jgi:hypothetical protein
MIWIPRRHVLGGALAVCAAIGSVSAGVAQAHRGSHAKQPHISAKPSNLMVNQSTALLGSGFPKHTSITLRECASASWIVPQQPCIEGLAVTVKTNGSGHFSTQFKVGVCEGTSSGPTQRTCYIGEPRPSGIDTMQLVGAVTIQVSYP